jgi:hypothetical protein
LFGNEDKERNIDLSAINGAGAYPFNWPDIGNCYGPSEGNQNQSSPGPAQ